MGVLNITDQVGGKKERSASVLWRSLFAGTEPLLCATYCVVICSGVLFDSRSRSRNSQVGGCEGGNVPFGEIHRRSVLARPGGTDGVLGLGLGSGTGPARLSVAARLADVSCDIRPL